MSPEKVDSLLVQPWFLHFMVPLLTVGLGIYLKFVSRNDRYTPFKKEDLAVGLEISVTALILFITGSVNVANSAATATDLALKTKLEQKLMYVPWLLLAFVLAIWGLSTLIRKIGWASDTELHSWWGVAIPDGIGIVILVLVVNWIG